LAWLRNWDCEKVPKKMSIFEVAGGHGIEGEWNFIWEGGSFPVEFRPQNVFFCEQFQAHAHWSISGNIVSINWGKYGEYELTIAPDGKSLEGGAKGAPANWRKATPIRSLTSAELAIIGSVWNFQHEGGAFEIQVGKTNGTVP
jgi:hypothetical protein